jgi:hypothetical protein
MAVTFPAVAVWIHARGARFIRAAISTIDALCRQVAATVAAATCATIFFSSISGVSIIRHRSIAAPQLRRIDAAAI